LERGELIGDSVNGLLFSRSRGIDKEECSTEIATTSLPARKLTVTWSHVHSVSTAVCKYSISGEYFRMVNLMF
jgi:hypothetical protein